jgi:hypothetical protein
MKKILFAVVTLSMMLSCAAYAGTPDADHDARDKEAKLFLKASPPQALVDQMLDGLSKNPQAQFTAADIASIKSSVDYGALGKAMEDSLVKNFTVDELKTMTKFFGSPEGQSITKKMPAYMADVAPVLQQQLKEHVIALMKSKQQGGYTPAPAAAPAAPAAPAQH